MLILTKKYFSALKIFSLTQCIFLITQGLFFGLLVLVSALICLILFFVLIDHGELHVSQLAVFLADISHASIMLLSLLAILLGFCRIKQIKFHGEDDNLLTTGLLKVTPSIMEETGCIFSHVIYISSRKNLPNHNSDTSKHTSTWYL